MPVSGIHLFAVRPRPWSCSVLSYTTQNQTFKRTANGRKYTRIKTLNQTKTIVQGRYLSDAYSDAYQT